MARRLYGAHPRVTFVRGKAEAAGEGMRMDSPMGSQGTGGSRRSWQVSLADLCFLVLAAGLAAGVVRGAREVWGTGLSRWGSNGWSPTDPFREDRRPRGRGRIDLARAHPGARHPPSGSRPTIGRGSGSGRAPGDDGLARPCDRAPAGLHHAGVANPRRGPREVPGPRRRAARSIA